MSSAAKKLVTDIEAILAEFSFYPVFIGFPEDILMKIAEQSLLVEFPAKTEILTQGQHNDFIYFLSRGQVSVYVDGERVSKLQNKGDLVGEMSVITSRPVAATILAETDTVLVQVDSKKFLNHVGAERDLYQATLYRVYATVLAEKLNSTNQKAKHFEQMTDRLQAMQWDLEEANRTLEQKVEERTQKLEQQKAELTVGKNKVEELLNSKRFIFQKLTEFHDKHLIPLKIVLDDFRKKNPEDETVTAARGVVFDLQRSLGPLTEQYSGEQAIQGKRVLLVDANKKQQIVAKMALGGTGVILDLVSTVEEGREKLAAAKYDLVIFDPPNLELGNFVRATYPGVQSVLMTSDQVQSYLPALKQLSAIPNIVSRNEGDRTFTIKNIVTTVTKLLSRELFGLEKYLSWGADIQSKQITSSKQRAQIIADVDAYFEKLGVRRSNRDRIRNVLEEMLMNAIYDAPVDAEGKSLFNHLPRTHELVLKPEQQGLVRFGTDGMLVAISVQDPFGSLKGNILLKYLEANYSGQAAELNASEGKGGAGRGLHQIVENSDLVVFNVESGKKTEAIALFNVESKEAASQNPSFHLFIRG